MSFLDKCSSLAISLEAVIPIISLNSSAKISPVPGLFTQILSFVKVSPAFIFEIVTTVANAKSIVGASSATAPFEPPL